MEYTLEQWYDIFEEQDLEDLRALQAPDPVRPEPPKPRYRVRRVQSAETKAKISAAKKGQPVQGHGGGWNRGMRMAPPTKAQISKTLQGYTQSEEHVSKRSQSLKQRNAEKLTCDRCGKHVPYNIYHRFHGDKCYGWHHKGWHERD